MKKVLLIVTVVMVAVMIATVFVGCSAKSYQKQLEKEGYTVSVYTGNEIADNSIEFKIEGRNESSEVEIIKFKNESDAKNVRDEYNELAKDYGYKVSGTGKIVKVEINLADLSAENHRKLLEKDGYKVEVITGEEAEEESYEFTVWAVKENSEIYIAKFLKASDAENAKKDLYAEKEDLEQEGCIVIISSANKTVKMEITKE